MNDSDIEAAFAGTNFGGTEETDAGRRGLMLECILKCATGYSDGFTITSICQGFGLVDMMNAATKEGMQWMFAQLYIVGGGPSVLKRIAELEAAVSACKKGGE